MILRTLALLCLLPAAAAGQSLRVTYLANEGVMLETPSGRVLIDALFGDGLESYQNLAQPMRDSLESASGAFGGRAVTLATHLHRDHFDATATLRYLTSNPSAVAILPADAFERAHAASPTEAVRTRVHTAGADEGAWRDHDLGWVHVRALGMPHGHTTVRVDHAAWLVRLDGWTALHIGDTQMPPGEWHSLGLAGNGVDVALIPYWYMMDDDFASALIAIAKPRTIVILHGPVPGGEGSALRERGGWDGLRRELQTRYPQLRAPWTAGEVIVIERSD